MPLLDISISFVDGAVARRILLGTYDVTVEKCRSSRQCMMTVMATRLIGSNNGSRAIRLQLRARVHCTVHDRAKYQ